MAQQPSKLQVWKRRGKLFVGAVALLGLGYLVGLEIVAPSLAHASDTHLPESVATMSMGTIEISTAGNVNAVVPVRIADTYDSREQGLNDVGAEVLETTFLLYAHDEVTDYGETYGTEGLRAPLSLAVIGGDGKVLGIRKATRKTDEIDVDKAHRWALAARRGWLDKMGIQPGSQMDTDAITKFSPDSVATR
ncbi:MAG: DUF192 domain-containing protein [Candidatus Bipolaricaulia bacterium]